MSTQEPFTIEQFYNFIKQGKLMAGKCQKCGKIHLPPRPLCDNCYSQQFTWLAVSGKGKLLTYTVIHIAPQQFQNLAPYAIGIFELENNLKITGIIEGVPQDQLKIGMELTLDLTSCNTTQQWPQWSRYCFKP
ncbi:MAG: Zn-ribbon domain-containing OB-fold protein [Candidatus Bathyarchaeota archaeon]|nr:Zn-ribbon domain-containing OB-fold protein [Candidatus Bathyarchaeota archaeon]